jgi:carboxymethylenebutenolidase
MARTRRFAVLPIAVAVAVVSAGARQAPAPFGKQRVTFKSGALTLVGFLFKPEGPGKFPALIWNHGSERNPGTGPQFDAVASIFVPAGFVVFAPMRRGHGLSEGRYITDQVNEIRTAQGAAAAEQAVVRLLETEQLDDQMAGLEHVKHLDFVDTTRLAVAGCSYGGIQTLLGAERGAGYKAAVSISPAALSWAGNRLLRERLVRAVRKIDVPVLLLQPAKDASLEPSRALGAEFARLGKPYTGKIYPATGPEEEQTHCFGGARGFHVWAADAISFLGKVL